MNPLPEGRSLDEQSSTARWFAWVFPCWPIGAISLTGFVVEAGLLARGADSIYSQGLLPRGFALLLLAWFWLSAGLIVWHVARWCDGIRSKAGVVAGITAQVGFAALAIAVLIQHISSWGLYFKTGRFANLEALLFILRNPPQTTWLYLGPGERTAITVLALVAVVSLIAAPKFLGWIAQRSDEGPSESGNTSAWGLLTIGVLFAGFWITSDPSPQRRATRLDTLRHRLSPLVTLTASGIDTLFEEPIAACIDPSDLTPLTSVEWAAPAPSDRNRPPIIIIAIESLRHDVVGLVHQGREVMPNLNRLSKDSLHLKRAYAQSTHSDYADVCIVSSLYPLRSRRHHYYQRSDPWPKTLIYDLLRPAGYATAIISSQNESWGCMDQFLESPNLSLFYDAKRSGADTYIPRRDPGFAHEIEQGAFQQGCLYDQHTMDTAIGWVTEQSEADRPFFLSMNFQASHFPYELPAGCAHPFQPCQLDADISFMEYARDQAPSVRNAYYNALHECDRQLGRMVAALERLGILDDSILIVLGENGEAFHENGSVGHAREPVEPAIHVATVIHAPKYVDAGKDDYPFEHVDLAPSVLARMDWPAHPNFQGIDALSPSRPPADERLLFFHVLSPAAKADAVMLGGRWKLIHSYDTDREYLFDVVADPGETTNRIAERPALAEQLRRALFNWRQRQLAYYHFPFYYRQFFPPAPPRWQPGVMATTAHE
jgi:arylsulfatase A-like enzyme